MGDGLWARGAGTFVRVMWRFRSEVSTTCPGPLPAEVTSKDFSGGVGGASSGRKGASFVQGIESS